MRVLTMSLISWFRKLKLTSSSLSNLTSWLSLWGISVTSVKVSTVTVILSGILPKFSSYNTTSILITPDPLPGTSSVTC